MGIGAGKIDAIVHHDDRQTVTVEIREQDKNLLVGYVEISLVPVGARVLGTNANNSEVDGHLILHAEATP